MTLLNIANDGYYNVLIALCRALVVERNVEGEKLVEVCSNKTDQSRNRLRQTLLRWTQLGLFVDDGGMISFCGLAAERSQGRKNPNKISDELPGILREIVFQDENNQPFWDKEKTKAADLTRGLSWILSQYIYDFPLDNNQKVQEMESRQVNDIDKRMIQNDVRLNGLRSWARYLGFTWQSKEPMIDPTVAISQELPKSIQSNKAYPVDAFLNSLTARLPVLDGGLYRKKVEETLDPQQWVKPPRTDMLSTSLSRALWRLELQGVLELETRADSQSRRVLQRKGGEELKAFTHVVYRGATQ